MYEVKLIAYLRYITSPPSPTTHINQSGIDRSFIVRTGSYFYQYHAASLSSTFFPALVASVMSMSRLKVHAGLCPVLHKLHWGHNLVLLDKLGTEQAIEHNWSRNILVMQIETHLLERSATAVTNFPASMPKPQTARIPAARTANQPAQHRANRARTGWRQHIHGRRLAMSAEHTPLRAQCRQRSCQGILDRSNRGRTLRPENRHQTARAGQDRGCCDAVNTRI